MGWEKPEVYEDYARTLKQEVQSASAESKNLVEMQDESRDIRLVKDWMEDGTRPEYSKVTAESYMVKSLWAQWSRLVLKDDLLCRMWEVEESNNILTKLLCRSHDEDLSSNRCMIPKPLVTLG